MSGCCQPGASDPHDVVPIGAHRAFADRYERLSTVGLLSLAGKPAARNCEARYSELVYGRYWT